MLAPGFSRLSTSSAPTGSDTAAKTTGIPLSVVIPCIPIATGVATPTIRSTSSAMKLAIICCITLVSRLQLSSTISKVTPFSCPISPSRSRMFAMIWFRLASSTKLQMPILKLVFSSASAPAHRDSTIIRDRANAINFFMFKPSFQNVFFVSVLLSGSTRV